MHRWGFGVVILGVVVPIAVLGLGARHMSEDGLYLNIWAPSVKHRGFRGLQKAAVMIFIHGGSCDTGASSVAYYDGTNSVRNHDDLIVVTFK